MYLKYERMMHARPRAHVDLILPLFRWCRCAVLALPLLRKI